MSNFDQTIKNLIKLIKIKISTKADLNSDNIFRGNITVDKKLLVKNESSEFVNILDIVNDVNSKSHTHNNISSLNLISDKIENGSKVLSYNNELYQKKFQHELNSEILSKFTYTDGILYFDNIKVINTDNIQQKSYNVNEKVTEAKLVEINFSTISEEQQIKTITNSEIIIKNNSNDTNLSLIIGNKNIDGGSELLIPPSKTHIYSTGINKDTILKMNGTFDYSFTINYF